MADTHNHGQATHHHILPNKTILTIGITLMILTVVTVWVAGIDLGRFNFLVAMVVATIKALLVAFFFMNLLYERRENGVIFFTSFLFLAIFIVLTGTDLFFRGDVYVKPGQAVASQGSQVSKLKDPWISTPELIARGKEVFTENQCATCHGAEGKGNGPAGAALNPPPRNFAADAGWKNGRRASGIFKTLKEGIAGSSMASYANIPADDRWALAQYVLSFNPAPAPKDTNAELAAVGFGPEAKGGGEAAPAPSISVELAMERIAAEAEAHQPSKH